MTCMIYENIFLVEFFMISRDANLNQRAGNLFTNFTMHEHFDTILSIWINESKCKMHEKYMQIIRFTILTTKSCENANA